MSPHASCAGRQFQRAARSRPTVSGRPNGTSLRRLVTVPQRTREHELDYLAELALRGLLPSGWVFRPTDRHDYGIDGSVEVFDEGEPTGQVFNVQLKGTDDEDADNRSAVRIRVGTGEYWNRLHLPTLVVRHHAGTDHVYARWWHECRFLPADGQQTVTIRFEAEHGWSDTTPAALSDGIDVFHRVRSARVELPLPVTLVIDPAVTDGRPPGVIRNAVRSAADRLPRLVALEADVATGGSVVVVITPASIEARLGGGITAELPNLAQAPENTGVGFDVLLTLALALGRVGLAGAATALIDIALPESNHRGSAAVLAQAGRTHLAAHKVEDGVGVYMRLLEEEASAAVVFSALRQLESTTGAHSTDDERALASGSASCAERLRDDEVAASAWLLAARTIRQIQPDLAVIYLRAAADRVPAIREDPKWLEGLAGALHDSEQADEAAELYSDLVARQPDALNLRACLADSLLVSGRILEAAETFRAYRSSGGADRRWIASERVATDLAARGCGDWGDAIATCGLVVAENDLAHPLPYRCRLALAWFNAGVSADADGQRDIALVMYLAAVVLFTADDEAWVQATVHALEAGDPMLFASVAEAAYAQRGYAFLDQLRTMTAQLGEVMRARLLDMFEFVAAGNAFGTDDATTQ